MCFLSIVMILSFSIAASQDFTFKNTVIKDITTPAVIMSSYIMPLQ